MARKQLRHIFVLVAMFRMAGQFIISEIEIGSVPYAQKKSVLEKTLLNLSMTTIQLNSCCLKMTRNY